MPDTQGVQGNQGDQGIQGNQGVQGNQGDMGDRGGQGIQGIAGHTPNVAPAPTLIDFYLWNKRVKRLGLFVLALVIAFVLMILLLIGLISRNSTNAQNEIQNSRDSVRNLACSVVVFFKTGTSPVIDNLRKEYNCSAYVPPRVTPTSPTSPTAPATTKSPVIVITPSQQSGGVQAPNASFPAVIPPQVAPQNSTPTDSNSGQSFQPAEPTRSPIAPTPSAPSRSTGVVAMPCVFNLLGLVKVGSC